MSDIKKEQALLKEELQVLFKEEINLRQDFLGHLTQIDHAISIGDNYLKELLEKECLELNHPLHFFSTERNILIQRAVTLFSTDQSPTNLESLLSEGEETLILYETLCLLIEKIHMQQMRNQEVSHLMLLEGEAPNVEKNSTLTTLDPLEEGDPPSQEMF